MRFTIVINHKVCAKGLSWDEAKRTAEWWLSYCPFDTVVVGLQ